MPQAVTRIRSHLDHMQRDWRSGTALTLDQAADRMRRSWPALDAEEARALAARQLSDGHWSFDGLHRSKAPIAFHLDRHLEQLRRIEAPVGLALGKGSWYAGIDRLQERIECIRPRFVEHLDGGHALHLEAHTALAALSLKVQACSEPDTR